MSTAEVRRAVDELARAWEAFKATNDERGHRDREKMARLNARIDQLETAIRRTPAGSSGEAALDPAVRRHKEAFATYVRNGAEGELAAIERKALSVGTDPEGGYLVPRETAERIAKVIFETSPLREVASVITVSAAEVEFLVDKDEAGASWTAETAARTETTSPDIAKVVIPTHEQYAEPRATQKLLDDAAIDVEAWLASKIAEKFSRNENTAFVGGDGVGRPRGFLSYPAGTAWGQIEQVNSGSAAALTADGLIELQAALKQGYLAGAVWVMRRSTVREVRKLKDTNGQYLWQPGLAQGQPAQLLGHPILLADDMPALAAGATPLAFGNFREGYVIVDRTGIRILRDPFTAKPFVKFYTTKRTGGDVVNFEAIKLQKVAA